MTDVEETTPSPADAVAAVAAAGAAAPPTEAPADLTGPWADQLKASFDDPAEQAKVDAFLRATVQPYVTKLEQSTADLQDAQRLYDDLNNSPGETFLAITEELFGDEAAARVTEALRTGEAQVAPDGNVEATTTKLDPETQALLDHVKEKKENEEYHALVDAFIANDHADIKKELFHPFVHAAEGDFDVAYAGYSEFLTKWKAENGVVADDPAEAEVETAPPALGSDTGGATAPPLTKPGQSLDEALDDFMNEQRAAPPVVGSV